VEKSESQQKRAQARKDGFLGELWTCLREAASAKAGPNRLESKSGDPTDAIACAYYDKGISIS
jgi:hypothetical protein